MSDDDMSNEPENGSNGDDNNKDDLASTSPGSDIVRVTIEDEMRQSYLGYAMSVIVGRALPDIRDGLKPVHRRSLYGMDQLNNRYDRPTMKSARVAGEVMGKYHPHGEAAIYDTIVHMAQPFKLRYPLVYGQGNFGSIDGDPPAASRYTEVRMTRLASFMLADLDMETVDMVPNYDETLMMPFVLPTRIPNLLVNGSYGIAVAMATNIPPHNLGEVVNACIALVDNSDLGVDDLMQHIKGPDFPTAGIINGRAGIVDSYKTGTGRILVRARATVETQRNGRESIVITEIPFQLKKSKLVESIADLVRDKKISGISELRDESSKDGLRVVIEIQRGEPGDVILNNLYKQTKLQSAVHVNFVALVDGQPRAVTLKDMLMEFILHRREVVIRRTTYQIREARRRAHTLEGQVVALADIDEIVNLIRESESRQDAAQALTNRNWITSNEDDADSETRRSRIDAVHALLKRADVKLARIEDLDPEFGFNEEDDTYRLSPEQADAILTLQLHRLVSLEQDRLIKEYGDLIDNIREFQKILDSEVRMNEVVKEELLEVRDLFADERRTEILSTQEDFTTIDMIAPMNVVVTLSHRGYAKIQPIDVYDTQQRGGQGKLAANIREDDFVEHLLVTHNHATLLCFSSKGRVFWLPTYEIPEASRNAQGRPIVNMLPLEKEERITTILPVQEFSDSQFVVMATEMGNVKRVELSRFSQPRRSGLIAIGLMEGDKLIGVDITNGSQEIFLIQTGGRAVKFRESDVRVMGRQARGVRGIRLRGDDRVISLIIPKENEQLLIGTENGYGKRSDFNQFRVTNRGSLGVFAIKTSERNGEVTGVVAVTELDEVMFITDRGTLIRTAVNQISLLSRYAQGVRLIRLKDDARLTGIGRIAESALTQNDTESESAEADHSDAGETTQDDPENSTED